MNRKFCSKLLLITLFVLLLNIVFAQDSDLTISVNQNNELVATYVFDDDGTIGVVDIFDFYPDGSYEQHTFERVYEGQVFSGVTYDETHTMYFNFTDYDGSITGLGYMRQLEVSEPPPNCGNGILEPELGEECEIDSDCPEGYSCNSNCICYHCGNGILQPELGEECEIDSDCPEGYSCNSSCDCYYPVQPSASLIVINDFELIPLIEETNDSFSIKIVVDVNKDHPITSGELQYKFSENASYSTIELTEEGEDYVTTLGPYTGEITLYGRIDIHDVDGRTFSTEFSNRWFNLIVPSEKVCPIVYPPIETKEMEGEDIILFASVTWDAYITISRNTQTNELFASYVSDDDNSIELVSIHVVQDGVDTQYNYQDVREGDQFITLPATYDDAYYNFSDFDGDRVNLRYLLSFEDYTPSGSANCGNGILEPELGEECEYDTDCPEGYNCSTACTCYHCGNGILQPELGEECESDADCAEGYSCDSSCACVEGPSPLPDLLYSATIKSRPSESGTGFYLDIEVEKNPDVDEIDSVEFIYSINEYTLDQTLALTLEEEKYVGTLGPFDDGKDYYLYSRVEARDYVESTGQTNTDSITDIGIRWYYLIPITLVRCIEICWDGLDNDADGLIDEGCVKLPELFFRDKEIPDFVIVGDPIEIDVVVKNSGVIDAGPFHVSVYIDDVLFEDKMINGLLVSEQERLLFSIDSNSLFGLYKLKIFIDSGNDVPELNEENNIFEQILNIGYNSFNVILNYNSTYLIGDERQVKFYDRFGKTVKNAAVDITLPNLQNLSFTTNEDGIVQLTLIGEGDYIVNATKEKFEPFNGSFGLAPIIVEFEKSIPIGQIQQIMVHTPAGIPISDATVEIILPNGERQQIVLNEEGTGTYRAVSSGIHRIIVSRKDVVFLEDNFESAGFIEITYTFTGRGLEALLGAEILRTPLLLLILLLMCLVAAYLAYSRSRRLFAKRAKSTREKQIETAVRIGIAIVFFILPLQVNRLFGFGAGVVFALVEIIAVFLFDYYAKRILRKRKAIRVERPKGYRL